MGAQTTLRRHHTTTRSKAQTIFQIDNNVSEPLIQLDVQVNEKEQSRIQAPLSATLEQILNYVALKRHFDVAKHTIEILGECVDMDRPLSYYYSRTPFNGIKVIQREKNYNMVCMSEDGIDVMIMRIHEGNTTVMAGSPEKLVERLTLDDLIGNNK